MQLKSCIIFNRQYSALISQFAAPYLSCFLNSIALNLATKSVWSKLLLQVDRKLAHRVLWSVSRELISLSFGAAACLVRLLLSDGLGLAAGQAETAQLFWHLIMAGLTGAWHFVAARTKRPAQTALAAGNACQPLPRSLIWFALRVCVRVCLCACVPVGHARGDNARKATKTAMGNVLNPVGAGHRRCYQ